MPKNTSTQIQSKQTQPLAPRMLDDPTSLSEPPESHSTDLKTKLMSWSGVILVLLVSGFICSGIIFIWQPVGLPQPSETERYFPLVNGTTTSFRVAHSDENTTFMSTNIEILRGYNAGSQIDAQTLSQVLSLVSDNTSQSGEVDPSDIVLARVSEKRYDATGTITPTSSLYFVGANELAVLAVNNQTFDPPLPILKSQMEPDTPRTVTGTLDGSSLYTATLTLEVRESVDTPLGIHSDCLRIYLDLQIAENTGFVRSWYCADIGIVQQESQPVGEANTQAYTLIGASTPGLTAHTNPPAPLASTGEVQPRGPQHTGWLSSVLPASFEPLWLYQNLGTNNDTTTPPLPTKESILYGLENGQLLSIDRTTQTLQWSFQTGGAIYDSPIVADGVVYVAANDRKLYALDLTSGTFHWAFAAQDVFSASPTIADGMIFVGAEDSTLYALDAQTGTARWQYTVGDSISSSPVVANGRVYVGANDGALYAFDSTSGDPRWAFAADEAITATPVVQDDTIYVGSYDGILYALDATTTAVEGESLWEHDTRSSIVNDFVVTTDTIYLVTEDHNIHAIDKANGNERWSYQSPSDLYGDLWIISDQLMIARETNILVLDAQSGTASQPITLGFPSLTTGVTSDGQNLFVGRQDGVLQILGEANERPWEAEPHWLGIPLADELFANTDALITGPVQHQDRLIYITLNSGIYSATIPDGSHELIGQLEDTGAILATPMIANDTLYAIDNSGVLLAFDLTNGQELWRSDTGGNTWSTPAIIDGRLLVSILADTQTTAYAFDVTDGNILWQQDLSSSFATIGTSALDEDLFYVAAESLYALDPSNGDIVWESSESVQVQQFAIIDDTIYTAGLDGEAFTLVGWDKQTGQNVLSKPITLPIFPKLFGGMLGEVNRLVLILQDGTTVAYNPTTGEEVWQQPPLNAPRGKSTIHNGMLLTQTADNHLLARSLDDGRLVGNFAIPGETSRLD
ncbi:MAG: PQQ-binding-like beta-propeller repeat protein, partial [Chloroflexota bacterium]